MAEFGQDILTLRPHPDAVATLGVLAMSMVRGGIEVPDPRTTPIDQNPLQWGHVPRHYLLTGAVQRAGDEQFAGRLPQDFLQARNIWDKASLTDVLGSLNSSQGGAPYHDKDTYLKFLGIMQDLHAPVEQAFQRQELPQLRRWTTAFLDERLTVRNTPAFLRNRLRQAHDQVRVMRDDGFITGVESITGYAMGSTVVLAPTQQTTMLRRAYLQGLVRQAETRERVEDGAWLRGLQRALPQSPKLGALLNHALAQHVAEALQVGRSVGYMPPGPAPTAGRELLYQLWRDEGHLRLPLEVAYGKGEADTEGRLARYLRAGDRNSLEPLAAKAADQNEHPTARRQARSTIHHIALAMRRWRLTNAGISPDRLNLTT